MAEETRKIETFYLAGPMRGYERFNFDAFEEATRDLRSRGFEVISPVEMDYEVGFDPSDVDALKRFDLEAAVRRDVEGIIKADAVVMLPGHEKSTGATAERHIAQWLGKMVLIYPHLLEFSENVSHAPQERKEDILEEALRLTSKERNNAYGPPDQDFSRTAKIWSALKGVEFSAEDVALFMIALKLSRATWMNKRDNWVDIAGYARCGFLCGRKGEKKENYVTEAEFTFKAAEEGS